jgi:1-deoxy-D-xylulose-5-phosphate reductoisomerase
MEIAVLGSTGTIGCYTLEVAGQFPDKIKVVSLACGKNIEKLKEQIQKFRPKVVSIESGERISELKNAFPGVEFAVGGEGIKACIDLAGVDTVVMGMVGFSALEPTLHAIRKGKRVALANKESLVVGGTLLQAELKNSSAELIPVDSEHNALFQLLIGRKREEISSVVLTASGGPLLRKPELPLEDVTPAIAVKHPNWNMGPKISVDSATLMNKGLEVIEAHYLFGFPSKEIEVWIHPQSIVHGAIWFKDNSCIAQMTRPDMKCSIGYALGYPERLENVIPRFSMKEMANLEFLEPDLTRFPSLRLAREALSAGPSAVIALNAANEIAVDAFLKGQILFPDIPRVIQRVLDVETAQCVTTISDIFEIDSVARIQTGEILKSL